MFCGVRDLDEVRPITGHVYTYRLSETRLIRLLITKGCHSEPLEGDPEYIPYLQGSGHHLFILDHVKSLDEFSPSQ